MSALPHAAPTAAALATPVGWRSRRACGLGLLLCALLALAAFSVCTGARGIAPATVWQALTAFDAGNVEHLLVRELRVPRTLLAILTGGALGGAGVLMQALARNPLADPGILGINAGAALAIVGAIAALGATDVAVQMSYGVAGAGVAGALVMVVAGVGRQPDPLRLVLAGAALSAVLLALTQVVTLNSDDVVFDQFRHWAVGSLQGRGRRVLTPVALACALGGALAFALVRSLDALALGRDVSHALGMRTRRIWLGCALAIVLLAGAATAAAGPIAFMGLAAPHLARRVAGPEHRWALPYAMLIAGTLLLLADVLGRWVVYPGEVGVGIVAALIGGPFFILLVRRSAGGSS